MRKYHCHHYNFAIERVNLPRSKGGRGLCSFPLDHDRAVVNLGRYLLTANDPLIAVVVKHQKWLECLNRSHIDTRKPQNRTRTGNVAKDRSLTK